MMMMMMMTISFDDESAPTLDDTRSVFFAGLPTSRQLWKKGGRA